MTIQKIRESKINVRRNPAYERPAKRGGGVTKESAKAELTLPDGKVIFRYDNVLCWIYEFTEL